MNSKGKPANLSSRQLKTWAKNIMEEKRQEHYIELEVSLVAGSSITVDNEDDEIKLKINGYDVLKIFTGTETPFIGTQWRHKTRDLNISEKFTPVKLVRNLLALRKCSNSELTKWFIETDKQIEMIDIEIDKEETSINELVFKLYGLNDQEITLIRETL